MQIFNTFFQELPDRTIAKLRIALGVLVLLHLAILFPHIQEYFSNEGILTSLQTHQSYRFSVLYFLTSTAAVTCFFYIILGAALALLVGMFPQVAAFICYLGVISFVNRFPQIGYGGFIFLSYALLFAPLLPLHRALVIRPFCSKTGIQFPSFVAAWAARMIQLEVCYIYLFAGLAKAANPHWIDGTQLLYTLNLFGAHWNFTFLQDAPALVAFMTWGSLILELGAPVMLFVDKIRPFWILGLCLMHIGIGLSMNVTFLGECMVGLLVIFI